MSKGEARGEVGPEVMAGLPALSPKPARESSIESTTEYRAICSERS
jgi:hypothetical protein